MNSSPTRLPIRWELPPAPEGASADTHKAPTAVRPQRIERWESKDDGFAIERPEARYVLGQAIADRTGRRIGVAKTSDALFHFVVKETDERGPESYAARTQIDRIRGIPQSVQTEFYLYDATRGLSLQFEKAMLHSLDEMQQSPVFQNAPARNALAKHLLPLVNTFSSLGSRSSWGHGDLQPQNIFFAKDLTPLFGNFDLRPSSSFGSRPYVWSVYLSPEAFQAYVIERYDRNGWAHRGDVQQNYSSRSWSLDYDVVAADKYSMGIILLETITGVNPLLASSVGIHLKDKQEGDKYTKTIHSMFKDHYTALLQWLRGGPFIAMNKPAFFLTKEGRWMRPFLKQLSQVDIDQRALHVAFDLLHPEPNQRGRLFEEKPIEAAERSFLVDLMSEQAPSKTRDAFEKCNVTSERFHHQL